MRSARMKRAGKTESIRTPQGNHHRQAGFRARLYLSGDFLQERRAASRTPSTVLRTAFESNPRSYPWHQRCEPSSSTPGGPTKPWPSSTRPWPSSISIPTPGTTRGSPWPPRANLDKALAAYGKALDIDGNSAIVFNNLGALHLSAFLKDGNPDSFAKATAAFRRAIELDPRYASAYNGLGAALKMSGDVDGGRRGLEKGGRAEAGFRLSALQPRADPPVPGRQGPGPGLPPALQIRGLCGSSG